MRLPSRLEIPGRHMTRDVHALYLDMAARQPDKPWYVKALLASAVVSFVSPIDPMPDLTPLLGYVDNLALPPLLFMLAMSLVPASLREECRDRAAATAQEACGRPG